MKITFIKPNIGRQEHSLYVDEGRMEPLMLAVLAGMTPPDVECVLYDDRMEPIPLDAPVDLVEYPKMDNSLAGLLQRLTDPGASEDAVRLARLATALEPIARVLAPAVEGSSTNNLRMPILQRSQ